MKKGLYYARVHSLDPVNLGALNKSKGIVEGFRKLGYNMDIVWYSSEGVVYNDSVLYRFPLSTNSESLKNILFHHLLFDAVIANSVDFTRYDFVFLRYPLAHPGFLRLLKEIRRAKENVHVYLEVATYPYTKELPGFQRKIQYWLDARCRKYLKKYVNYTINYGLFTELFGIPSLGIRNGVSISSLKISSSQFKPKQIRLLAVGSWNHWHGLDRLIKGLADYHSIENPAYSIKLDIVGEGREIPKYMDLVTALGIDGNVSFHKAATGSILDDYFDNADIAVGCLGIFRKDVELDSSLKHREYAGRAMPFIHASNDLDFPSDLPWVLNIPKDESPVDINEVINFANNLSENPSLKQEIRDYAETNLDWAVKLRQLKI